MTKCNCSFLALLMFSFTVFASNADAQLFGPPRNPVPLLGGAPVTVFPAVAPIVTYRPPAVPLYRSAYAPIVQSVQVVQYAPPVTSYPVTSYPVTSYPVTSYPVTSYPVTSYPVTRYPVTQRRAVNYGANQVSPPTSFTSPTVTTSHALTQSSTRPPVTTYRVAADSAPVTSYTVGPTVVRELAPVYDGPASVYDAMRQRDEKKPIESTRSSLDDNIDGKNLSPRLVNPDNNETILPRNKISTQRKLTLSVPEGRTVQYRYMASSTNQ